MAASEKVLRAATNKLVIALSKTILQIRGSFAREHSLSEEEVRVALGAALLRNAAMNLASAHHSESKAMIRLQLNLQEAYESWCDAEGTDH